MQHLSEGSPFHIGCVFPLAQAQHRNQPALQPATSLDVGDSKVDQWCDDSGLFELDPCVCIHHPRLHTRSERAQITRLSIGDTLETSAE
nr:hypothetical protein CFP56_09341 [Quercus suber]